MTYHLYCGGELRVTDGTFRCSNCGVTGTVERTPGEITLSDVRTMDHRTPIITDREIQLVEHATSDKRVQAMLRELVEFRRASREAISKHDLYRPDGYDPAIPLGGLVNRAGCQWWRCTAHAVTQRMSKVRFNEVEHLCTAHADEGEAQGLWNTEHPANQAWVEEDRAARARARQRTIEMSEDRGVSQGAARSAEKERG